MTTTEYHSKFFQHDSSWKQLAYRTYAMSQLEGVFGCPRRPSASELVDEVSVAKALTCYVLLGKDKKNECWHELAISREKDLIHHSGEMCTMVMQLPRQ